MDPITIATLGGGLIRGVSSLFGDSEEERRNKQRKRLLQAIRDQQGRNTEMSLKDKARADMELSSEKSDRRNVLSQKLAQYGYEPGGSIATNEKDLVMGNFQRKGDIEARLAEANAMLEGQMGEINAGIEDEPDPFGTFLGEGIKGASEGINFGKALGFLDPGRAGRGGGSPTTTPSKYDTPVTNPEISTSNLTLNPMQDAGIFDLSLGDGSTKGMDFQLDPKLTGSEDYSSLLNDVNMADVSDLAGYKNPFKKFNNMYRLRNR